MSRPGLRTHPKFLRLAQMLGEPLPHVLGHLEFLWGAAYECGEPMIGDTTHVELTAAWDGEPGKLCDALLKCGGDGHAGFIDPIEGEPGRYEVHDLFDHAPDYVRQRFERELARKKEKTCAHCGGRYRSADPRSKYCSPSCRTGAYRDRKTEPVTDVDGSVLRPSQDAPKQGFREHAPDQRALPERDSVTDTKAPPSREKQGRVTDCDGSLTDVDTTPAPAPAPAPKKRHAAHVSSPDGDSGNALEALVRDWNAITGVRACKEITPARRKAFAARFRDRDWVAGLKEALERVAGSDFCRGGGERGWKAHIDWFLRPDTVVKLLEGKYDGNPGARKTAPGGQPERKLRYVNPRPGADR